jgi:hypothetical protein
VGDVGWGSREVFTFVLGICAWQGVTVRMEEEGRRMEPVR